MNALRVLLFAVVLPLRSTADVAVRTPASSQPDPKASQEEAEREYHRGVQFAEGDGVAQDYTVAAQFYRRAAAKGLASAQYDLAYLYETG